MQIPQNSVCSIWNWLIYRVFAYNNLVYIFASHHKAIHVSPPLSLQATAWQSISTTPLWIATSFRCCSISREDEKRTPSMSLRVATKQSTSSPSIFVVFANHCEAIHTVVINFTKIAVNSPNNQNYRLKLFHMERFYYVSRGTGKKYLCFVFY